MATKDAHISKPSIVTPPSVGSQQVSYDKKLFDDLITHKGYHSTIERALKCPCSLDSDGNAALANCSNCGGSKWFYVDKTDTILALQGMNNNPKYGGWTEMNLGTAKVTGRADNRFGFMDRITVLELESVFSEMRKGILAQDGNLFFFTTYPALEIEHLYLFNGADNPLDYVPKGKYSIQYNKIVLDPSYIDTYTEREGLNFSVYYKWNPVFHIIEVNRELTKQYDQSDRTNKTPMPVLGTARIAHYLFNNPTYGGQSLYDNTYTPTI